MIQTLPPATRKWHHVNKWLCVARTADNEWAATWYVKRLSSPAQQYLKLEASEHIDTRTGEIVSPEIAQRLTANRGWVVGIFPSFPTWQMRKDWEQQNLPSAQLYAWSTTVLKSAAEILRSLGKEAVPSEELTWFECYKDRVDKAAKKAEAKEKKS